MLGIRATILGAIPLALGYASILEWLVHRFGYHEARVWRAATAAHHLHHEVRYPKAAFFEHDGSYETSQPFWLEALYVGLHLPAFALLAHFSVPAAATAFVVISLYATLAHYVHPLTHLRTGLPYERTRLWKKLVARHVRHHHEQAINFNVLLPLGDALFGTLDRERPRFQKRLLAPR
jgi:hypothetical protein